jgi:hypothetical protein
MHGEFLRLLFLQAHRETEAYFAFMGTPAQPDQDQFRFRRAAFYSSLKGKVGLIAAKSAALRVNMNTDSCLIASHAASRHLVSTHASSLFHSSLTHTLLRPRDQCVGWTRRHPSRVPSCFIAQLAYSHSSTFLWPSPSYSFSRNKQQPIYEHEQHAQRYKPTMSLQIYTTLLWPSPNHSFSRNKQKPCMLLHVALLR